MSDPMMLNACEGPNAEYVKLVSNDGHEFVIKRKYAMTSGTISAMLTGPGMFKENQTNVIHLQDISANVLHLICLYFTYYALFDKSKTDIPPFNIPESMAMKVLMAANFLDC